MARYTEEELEAAKDFLRRRIENELSMKRDVEDLLGEYAERLLELLFRDASDEAINALIDELCEQLIEDCYLLGVDERDNKREAIMLFMNSERSGDTMEGRVRSRGRTFFNEVFAVYLAAKLLGGFDGANGLNGVVRLVKEYLKKPWDNPLLELVREKIRRGEIDGNMSDFESPHFGKGVEISSMGALQTLLGYHVADAWMWWGYEDARERGAIGYYVLRGSSYPCDVCQSHVGVFYYITDETHRPQYHLNCCCFVVYSYTDRV